MRLAASLCEFTRTCSGGRQQRQQPQPCMLRWQCTTGLGPDPTQMPLAASGKYGEFCKGIFAKSSLKKGEAVWFEDKSSDLRDAPTSSGGGPAPHPVAGMTCASC